jgi:hypothetical protein
LAFVDCNDPDEAVLLETELEEDMQWTPSNFCFEGHPTTVLRFLMEQLNSLATKQSSDLEESVFHGFHEQVLQTLPGHSQHYLTSINLVGPFPSFAVKSSGLKASTYCLYLDNYLRGRVGKLGTRPSSILF